MIAILGLIVLVQWVYQVYNEFVQFLQKDEKIEHFYSLWNWVDLVGLGGNLFIIIVGVFNDGETIISIESIRVLASIVSLCIFVKLFDWLRLFESTAFYILLVGETLSDIQAFMIILLCTLLAFGVPMYMLNMNRDDDNAVIDSTFGFWGINVLLNQYFLALGEFNFDNFADNPQAALCFTFFIMSTFITQLTMLNMLIAIMGDTFGRIMEAQEVSGTKTKLELMADCDHTIPKRTSEQDPKVFLYVITPVEDENKEIDDTETAVHELSKQVKGVASQLDYMTTMLETLIQKS